MNRSPLSLAGGILLVLGGSVWILQGLDVAFAPESFMTDDRLWVLWGTIALLAGVFLIVRYARNR
ncbi:MAG TPA: hypothetical protein VIW94_05660 [Acidimicrobiia bacterium]